MIVSNVPATVSEGTASDSSLSSFEGSLPIRKRRRREETPQLLHRIEDESYLTPLHVFVRRQIEVFYATREDLVLPAPGRKREIKFGQVGIRCVHCHGKSSTKRAVCYPSSLQRLYHCVSDMKGDHLKHCHDVPLEIRQRLDVLAQDKRATSHSTAQYYFESAVAMGMVDAEGGVFRQESLPAPSIPLPIVRVTPRTETPPRASTCEMTTTTPYGLRLTCESDPQFLNSLHCFVRRHIEIFEATEQDVNAPAPGRKTRAVVGQIGLRCVHCRHQRIKRAVCYPPAVSGIYHAVSNMKLDHFAICPGLPTNARVEFEQLRVDYHRKASSNATAQYYHDAALRMGLVDSPEGIRLKRDGLSTLVLAATDPHVRAAYRQTGV